MGNKQTRTTVYDSVPQETRGEGGNEIPYETLREDETINIGNICVLWGVLKSVMDEKGFEYTDKNVIEIMLLAAIERKKNSLPSS